MFRNRQPIVAIPREKANFLIRKIDDNTFWVIHQEEEAQKNHAITGTEVNPKSWTQLKGSNETNF